MRLTRVHIVAIVCVVIAIIALAVGLGVGFGMKPSAMSGSTARLTREQLQKRLLDEKRKAAARARAKKERTIAALQNRVIIPTDVPTKAVRTTPKMRGDIQIYETDIGNRYIIREDSYCREAQPIEIAGATVHTSLNDALNMAWDQSRRNNWNDIAAIYRDRSGMWRGCRSSSKGGDATWPARENGQPPFRMYEFEAGLLGRKLRFNHNGYLESQRDIRKMRKINGQPINIDGTSYLYDDLQAEIAKDLERQRTQAGQEIA